MDYPAPHEDKDEQEHRQQLELTLLQFKIRIATIVVGSVIFGMLGLLIFDAAYSAKAGTWHGVPDWFVDLCKQAITAGLAILTLSLRAVTRKRK